MRLRAFLVCILVSSRAFAQTGSETSTADEASSLYVEGKELREAGDLKKSLQKLEAAHGLYATPITALEVGRARALVGQLRGAVEALESVEQNAHQTQRVRQGIEPREWRLRRSYRSTATASPSWSFTPKRTTFTFRSTASLCRTRRSRRRASLILESTTSRPRRAIATHRAGPSDR